MSIELHEDLRSCLQDGPIGPMIHHPLVIDLFAVPDCYDSLNRRYAAICERVGSALAKGDYSGYVSWHEKPYRAEALFEVAHDIEDDTEFWRLVSETWAGSENIFQNVDIWVDLLCSDRSGREAMMSADEQQALADMPEKFTVYRGTVERYRDDGGLSWTTDYDKAEWFAERFEAEDSVVLSREVSRDSVVAYLTSRGENEIILQP